MRLIKMGIISAIVIFVLVYLMSLLIPSHVRISRAVNIRGDKKSLSNWAMDLDDWHSWNVLISGIPENKLQYRDHILSSDSLEITLTLATPDTVKTVWKSHGGKEIAGVFTFSQSGNVTVMQWYFDFHLRWYPWEKFASINFDRQWGPYMEKSLDNIKKVFERVN